MKSFKFQYFYKWVKVKMVYHGGSLPGCCSHRVSLQKAFTALYLGILQPKEGQHTPRTLESESKSESR